MTTQRRDGKASPYEVWQKTHPRLEGQDGFQFNDVDLWCFRWASCLGPTYPKDRTLKHLGLIELKTYGASPSRSQREVLQAIHQIADRCRKRKKTWRGQPGGIYKNLLFKTEAGRVNRYDVRWWGVALAQMSGSTPANSETILWNGRKVTEDEYVDLLRFDRHWSTLVKRDDRRHRPAKSESSLFTLQAFGISHNPRRVMIQAVGDHEQG